MPLTNDEVTELARHAVQRMFNERGPDYRFPFDAVWLYVESGVNIPGTARPHQAGRLLREGWIETTGAIAKAVSEKRAGSSTPEYRFGHLLVKRQVPVAALPVAGSKRASDLLTRLQLKMDSEGYVVSVAQLANFYLAMMTSPLVILSGISGTGKSLLPRKFAQHTKSGFKPVPVQPQWSDNSDLFGYVPTLSPEKFIKGHLIDSLIEALDNPEKLMIALLDEMNLAPVEHYFSDFLSVAETRRRNGGVIQTDALPIELPYSTDGQEDKYKRLRNIGLPHNLRVIGTANMDESTHSFSPKVLDRAFAIEFDDPDLTAFATAVNGSDEDFSELAKLIGDQRNPISVQEARATNQELFDQVAQMLQEIQDILAPSGIKFGYRTRDSILLYLHFWRQLGLEDIVNASAALDFCLLQKVLPKILGSGDTLADALTKLKTWLQKDRSVDVDGGDVTEFTGPFVRSLQKIDRMAALLEVDGSTHYWGT